MLIIKNHSFQIILKYRKKNLILLKDAINSALAELKKMKMNEGRELANDLHKRINNIENNLNFIESEAVKECKGKFC